MRKLGLTVALVVGSALIAQAYVLNAPWRTPIVYYINPANPYGFTPVQVEAALAKAVQTWRDAEPTLQISYGGRTTDKVTSCNNKNVIYFDTTRKTSLLAEAISCYEYRTDENGARYRYRKYDVDIPIFTLKSNGVRRKFMVDDAACVTGSWYLQDVMTHEMGHLVGLGHVTPSAPTMYKSLGACSRKWRSLEPDDIAGVRYAYQPGVQSGGE